MSNDKRTQFAGYMSKLFSIYKQSVTPLLMDAWWGVLNQYPIEEIAEAMNLHATDTKRGMYPPVVADIVLHLNETIPRQRREQRGRLWTELRDRLEPLEQEARLLVNDVKLELKTEAQIMPRMNQIRIEALRIKSERQYDAIGVAAPARGVLAMLSAPEGGSDEDR